MQQLHSDLPFSRAVVVIVIVSVTATKNASWIAFLTEQHFQPVSQVIACTQGASVQMLILFCCAAQARCCNNVIGVCLCLCTVGHTIHSQLDYGNLLPYRTPVLSTPFLTAYLPIKPSLYLHLRLAACLVNIQQARSTPLGQLLARRSC